MKIKGTAQIIFENFVKLIFSFSFCGGFYYLLELVWKQHSDTSMFLIGGVIGSLCFFVNNIYSYDFDFLAQIGSITALTTVLEGIVGNLINTDFHIWDYRPMKFGNFWNNQCNIIFVGIWALLIGVFIPILDYMDWKLFDYEPNTPPYYIIFGKKIFQFKKKKCHCCED